MKINFDGLNKELTGEFPRRFKLSANGTNVPFIRLGANKIRLTQDVPAGEFDIQEVIQQKRPKPAKLGVDQIALINKADFDQIDILSKKLGINQELMNKQIQELTSAENVLATLETENAQEIAKTNDSMRAMAGAVGSEIQKVRVNSQKETSALNAKIKETGDILSLSIAEHTKAKNPHKITKATIGLDKVDNTPDLDKPISNAVAQVLENKAEKKDIEELSKKLSKQAKKQDAILKGLGVWGGVGTGGSGEPVEASNVIFRSW